MMVGFWFEYSLLVGGCAGSGAFGLQHHFWSFFDLEF